jgi:hypothetical protein
MNSVIPLHDRSAPESGSPSAILLCRKSANVDANHRAANVYADGALAWPMVERAGKVHADQLAVELKAEASSIPSIRFIACRDLPARPCSGLLR